MKNSFPASGSDKCSSLGSIGVGAPKYTRTRSPIIASPSRIWRICIAESTSKNETMMRRNDLRGAQLWIGTEVFIKSLICWILSALNICISLRFVMRSVFDGGVGCWSGGMPERSIDSGVRGLEDIGELSAYILANVQNNAC